ncbi:membrane-tethered transcription factor (SPT23), putative [Macrophomina phaseolina MS6]|uniref:Membrane-tethered transcription factor (SPT23), putative n=1 Tax=Macrophomina phaseolina (strain MS6) TaxID=1126212 RepID=K2S3Z6_MACPH|nr:membrane-tethered transcription factor (SPT23), putative [Macrophomina phaseolina MS6]
MTFIEIGALGPEAETWASEFLQDFDENLGIDKTQGFFEDLTVSSVAVDGERTMDTMETLRATTLPSPDSDTEYFDKPPQTPNTSTSSFSYHDCRAIQSLAHTPSALYVQHNANKSRVETQIKTRLILDPLPPGVTKLHLPYWSVGKAKYLVKKEERVKSPDTLELHTSLVRASAMKYEDYRRQSLSTEAIKINTLALPGEQGRQPTERGGNVRICQLCKLRERKRASRKVGMQGDEQLWREVEDERVIIFNDTEYKEWRLPSAVNDCRALGQQLHWRSGAMQVELPMRIACYCRHHGEQSGFWYVDTPP